MHIRTLLFSLTLLFVSTSLPAVELFPIPDNSAAPVQARPPRELAQFRDDLIRQNLSCSDLVALRNALLERTQQDPQNQNFFLNRMTMVNDVIAAGRDCQ